MKKDEKGKKKHVIREFGLEVQGLGSHLHILVHSGFK